MGYIAPLNHKPIDYSVKFRVHVGKFDVTGSIILAGTEASKIFAGFGCEIGKQFEDDSAGTFWADLNIHVDFGVGFGAHFGLVL